MSKVSLAGVAVLVVLVVAGVFFLSTRSGSADDLNVLQTSPAQTSYTSAPSATAAPAAMSTITPLPSPVETMPAETEEPAETAEPPVEEYADAAIGTYKNGDKVYIPEYNIRGTIGIGVIENGKILSETFILDGKDGNTIMGYTQIDHPTYGHLELILFPHDGYVIMKQNGKKIDRCLKYDRRYNFNDYLLVVFEPEKVPAGMKSLLTC